MASTPGCQTGFREQLLDGGCERPVEPVVAGVQAGAGGDAVAGGFGDVDAPQVEDVEDVSSPCRRVDGQQDQGTFVLGAEVCRDGQRSACPGLVCSVPASAVRAWLCSSEVVSELGDEVAGLCRGQGGVLHAVQDQAIALQLRWRLN